MFTAYSIIIMIIFNIITLNQYETVLIIIIFIVLPEIILLNEVIIYNNVNEIN